MLLTSQRRNGNVTQFQVILKEITAINYSNKLQLGNLTLSNCFAVVLFFLQGKKKKKKEEGKKIVLTFVAVPSTVLLRVHALIKAILQLQMDAFSALNFLESKHGCDTVGEGGTVTRCFIRMSGISAQRGTIGGDI